MIREKVGFYKMSNFLGFALQRIRIFSSSIDTEITNMIFFRNIFALDPQLSCLVIRKQSTTNKHSAHSSPLSLDTNHITIVVQNYFSSIIRWDSRFLVFIFFTGLGYLSFLLHFDLQKISCLLSAWAFFLDTLSLSPWISEVFFFICGTSYKSCWSAFGLIFLIIFSIKWSKREEGQFRAPIL